ncbi:MAG TPA: preprotein translocase subunit SecA [Solirubrobacterales bacterium]|jgi:preprotein translocase subunit SecA|nr:preprotein translocase subunit SecA [Solirubrobacterales bacterium]
MAKGIIDRALRLGEGRKFKDFERRVESINRFEPEMELLSDSEIREAADELRERARGGESLDDLLPEAFALCREAAKRTLGQRHYDVQLIGGMVLHDGSIAEMKTGEGKTLTATLSVFLNTLEGDSVHLVTVNDYLARRDAEWMKPIYDALGVSVGVIQSQMSSAERRAMYAADVTYGTNSEFGFDYLRDNMASRLEETVQPKHVYAIVDEVDNILIDEARTPLIISGAPEQAADLYYTFARLAKQLVGEESKPKLKSLGEDRDTSGADYDYEYDEKHKTVAPTERGVERAEKFLGVDNLYVSEHGTLVNHLIQALKAESLFKRDTDYAVIDGEVKIIDEFTGRILEGRRWSEGLHQAVEAKEGVRIREENQTLATITLQNYFRLYDKLAGMTGTALTEATEFMKIYEMPVVEIPTNVPMIRDDHNDQIYKTKGGKWKAVADEIAAQHERGQPVLVGTISVEVSEMLSDELRRAGVEHVVLNAKPEHAQREGETVAQAGRLGAVTIATNMAGRGVDIKLGGDPEQMARHAVRKTGLEPGADGWDEAVADLVPELAARTAAEGEKIKELGGLFICGTERHESRRIDNQLRGRSGRQGDPGESRFFLSAEDDLIRLFAGERIYKILDRLGPVDEEGEEYPLEAKMLTRTIENAQKKVEQQNFLIRKRVLEYDDVMNEQRRVIYKYRREILEGRDMSEAVQEELEQVVGRMVEEYTPGEVFEDWDLGGLETQAAQLWPLGASLGELDPQTSTREQISEILASDALAAYDRREEELGSELMRYLERQILLQIIDNRWREHLYEMDYLREGIHLRGFAQIDPLVAYKNEGFQMFSELMNSIWEEFARIVFHVEVNVEPAQAEEMFAAERSGRGREMQYAGGGPEQPSAMQQAASAPQGVPGVTPGVHPSTPAGAPPAPSGGGAAATATGAAAQAAGTVVKSEREKLGRNDPCWCGSGKKYKKCHGA